MISTIEKENLLKKVFEDMSKVMSDEVSIYCVLNLLHARKLNIPIEDYIFIDEKISLSCSFHTYKEYINTEEESFIENLKLIYNKKEIKPSFPNSYLQGYLIAMYYTQMINNIPQFKDFLGEYYNKYGNQSAVLHHFKKGLMCYFKCNYDINEIYPFLSRITKRNIPTNGIQDIDLISIFLIMNFTKQSIWEINKKEIERFFNLIRSTFEKVDICTTWEGFFNFKIYDFLCWWRAAYLNNSNLPTPPGTAKRFSTIFFEEKTLEENLQFITGLIKFDKAMVNQVTSVYKKFKDSASDHYLRQNILREFCHYYKYCEEQKINFKQTESIPQYLENKHFDKADKQKNQIINCLRNYFRLSMQIGFYKDLDCNPVAYRLNKKTSKFSKLPDAKVIPARDIDKIFSILDQMSEFEKLFIKLLYHTGIRIGEALSLTVNCVREITEDSIMMYVPPHKFRKNPLIVVPKTEDAIETIVRLVEIRKSFGKMPHSVTGISDLWLLTHIDDEGRGAKHLNIAKANRVIKKACELAGVKDYTNHCFRHTFAHEKLNKEKRSIEDISLMLGHADTSATILYTKLTSEEKLVYYSRLLNRKEAAQLAYEKAKQLNIITQTDEFVINIEERTARWCGTGWCNSEENITCSQKYRSCYPCPNYSPALEDVYEIMNDFYANIKLLEVELENSFPIQKEVMHFINIISGIIKCLKNLGLPLETEGKEKEIVQKAHSFLEAN